MVNFTGHGSSLLNMIILQVDWKKNSAKKDPFMHLQRKHNLYLKLFLDRRLINNEDPGEIPL